MPNQQGNGRNVAVPDENRPSWRPEDENVTARTRRSMSEDDDRYRDDERHMHRDRERYGSYWDDRTSRNFDRDDVYRTSDRYGDRYAQGQSGYTAGRYEDDRSMRFQSRNQNYPGSFEERQMRDRGMDDRFYGRGGSNYYGGPDRGFDRSGNYPTYHAAPSYYGQQSYNPERTERYGARGYGRDYDDRGYGHEPDRPGGYLGQGGQQMGYGGQPGQLQGGSPGRYSGTYGHTGRPAGYRGLGPSGWARSDERIKDAVCEALFDDDNVDATHIEISVKNGDVTLAGMVEDRQQKRLAEQCVEHVRGVKDVQNQLRVGADKKPSTEPGKRSLS